MAKSRPHLIKRQILELRGLRQEDAHEMQERMRQLYHQRLLPLIDRYLSQLSPNEQSLRIEQMELNLGPIDVSDFEAALIKQLEKQLQVQLARLSPPSPALEEKTLSPLEEPGDHPWELFHYFVETGSLPWWVDIQAADPVLESVDHLLDRQPDLLIAALSDWLPYEPYLRRLVRQLPPDRLVRLAGLQAKLTTGNFEALIREFLQLLNPLAATLCIGSSRFREEAQLKLLQIAYTQATSTTASAGFWEAWLLQLSVIFRRPYPQLLENLQAILTKLPGASPTRTELKDIIQQLITNQDLKPATANPLHDILELPEQELQPPEQSESQDLAERSDLPALFQWLTKVEALAVEEQQVLAKAYLAWYQAPSPGSREMLRLTLEKIFDRHPSIRPALAKKWAVFFTEVLAKTVLPFRLQEILTSLIQKLQTGQLGSPEITLLLELLSAARSQSPEWEKRGRLSTTKVDRRKSTEEPTNDTFSKTSDIFIANAGLVVLWPFLLRFFQSLGLVEDKLFVNTAAAHRAAGLLQYLADGQAETPEYLLAFNKILCGLDWDEVLDFGEPITKAEAEECDLLLQAVIANAPVLKNMSIDGFRGTFLLRKGMLRSLPDMWELRVEKESYDVVLEQFPWSWKVVKLPWLEGVVVVEW